MQDIPRSAFAAPGPELEAQARQHLRGAEAAAAEISFAGGVPAPRPVQRVGVVGGGTMGTGIAMTFANAGLPVTLVEANAPALEKALATIGRQYAATAAKGKLSSVQVEQRLALIDGSTEMAALAGCDLLIEAVFEDMAVKRTVFEQLDRIARPGAILASNTSRLDVNAIAQMTSRPADVLGLHFFSPAHVMRLLEVVRGAATAPDVLLTAMRLAQRVGKVPVMVGVCDGFVGNRMVSPYTREAHFLLEEGASPQQVDQALERFGMAMGPLRMGDMAGLDISWAARKRQAATRDPALRYCRVADRLCEAGRLGQKTGSGFYRYEAGSRTPLPDPAVDAIVEQCASESGIQRRAISDDEIVERCIYALVNEGARILAEGIAARAGDIDVIYVNGYSFPAARGGPMFFADTVGLAPVLLRIQHFHRQHGALWAPAPLLAERVSAGRRLCE
ncbi:MAG: 3-hydroxyacyl-CoA dehydrogenase [Burkholderiales bacterium]|nr:3-hydroxyacyl-CoA dehydrogenase [Burkholderiales bacterium]